MLSILNALGLLIMTSTDYSSSSRCQDQASQDNRATSGGPKQRQGSANIETSSNWRRKQSSSICPLFQQHLSASLGPIRACSARSVYIHRRWVTCSPVHLILEKSSDPYYDTIHFLSACILHSCFIWHERRRVPDYTGPGAVARTVACSMPG